MSSLYFRLNILLPEGTAVDDNNGGAFGPIHKVYDIWLDDFERRSTYFFCLQVNLTYTVCTTIKRRTQYKKWIIPLHGYWIAVFPCKYVLIVPSVLNKWLFFLQFLRQFRNQHYVFPSKWTWGESIIYSSRILCLSSCRPVIFLSYSCHIPVILSSCLS
jgi:hypothetical protein